VIGSLFIAGDRPNEVRINWNEIERAGIDVGQRATPAMLKWFGRANELGQIAYRGPRGLGRSAWERCMKRAQAAGFVIPNAHGEFELTTLGRAQHEAGAIDN